MSQGYDQDPRPFSEVVGKWRSEMELARKDMESLKNLIADRDYWRDRARELERQLDEAHNALQNARERV